ncbi:unnamed protein product [Malus baccata var. baccata]
MFDAYSIIEWFYSHYFQVVVCQVPFLTLECLQLQAISTRICSNPFIIFRWVTAVMPDSRSSGSKTVLSPNQFFFSLIDSLSISALTTSLP